VVYVSCPPAQAEPLAAALVEQRLAACVNVLPQLRSLYLWKGELQRDDEALLLIKTNAERLEALKTAVLALHPYELPEFLAVPVASGHAPYLQWIADSLA
jgi:periplasmic divalent cation tolerance protein